MTSAAITKREHVSRRLHLSWQLPGIKNNRSSTAVPSATLLSPNYLEKSDRRWFLENDINCCQFFPLVWPRFY